MNQNDSNQPQQGNKEESQQLKATVPVETSLQVGLPTEPPALPAETGLNLGLPPIVDTVDKGTETAEPMPAQTERITEEQAAAAQEEKKAASRKQLDKEAALAFLIAGKPVEEYTIPAISFAAGQQFPHKIVVKNCLVGSLEFGGATLPEEIVFDNVRFQKKIMFLHDLPAKCEITWSGCCFEKPVEIADRDIGASLNFLNSTFQAEFEVKNSRLSGGLNLSRANFLRKVTLRQSNFDRFVDMGSACFENQVIFSNIHFDDDVQGEKTVFRGPLQINDCRFSGKTNLSNINSEARIDIERTTFEDRFKGYASLIGNKLVVKESNFKKGASWNATEFKNDIAFPQTVFETDVNFDGASFRDLAFFDECTLTHATFRGAHFYKALSFVRAKIYDEFLWQGTQCEGTVCFDFANLHGRVSFSDMIFHQQISCYRTNFKGQVWFLGTRFHDASFVNTNFEGETFFSFDRNTLRERNCRRKKGTGREQTLQFVSLFDGRAKFTNAVFYRKTVFENVFFKKHADFENTCFAEEIDFANTHFQEGASFKGSFCTQELDFTKAVFDDYVNFDLANINRRLNLTDAAFDRGISFYHAVIDVVVVEYDQVRGRLVYEGKVPGYEHKKHLMRVKEEYLILKESFNQRGKFHEEDWAYYRYRVNDRKSLTVKAWRSLCGAPILAVQDDVPAEEQEKDETLIENIDKIIDKTQKTMETNRKRMEKLEAAAAENPHKKTRDIDEIKEKMAEDEKRLERQLNEKQGIVEVVNLNKKRQQKLRESRDQPFSKFEAANWLLRNAWWKLVDWGTGYGVRPFRLGLLALAVIFVFASVYFTSGAAFTGHDPNAPSLVKFLDWFYFSAMTFATASPEGELFYDARIQFFIMMEALIGVFLMALFVGCYTRKIMR